MVSPDPYVSPVCTPLQERHAAILRAVVQGYIASGEPVGSKAVCQQAALGLSPATVRSAMGVLEALGYLRQPHPSAGRLPTSLGLRAYVDSLLSPVPISSREMRLMADACSQGGDQDLDQTLQTAGEALAEIVDSACVVLSPDPGEAVFCRIKLVAIASMDGECAPGFTQVLALLLTQSGQLQSVLFDVEPGLRQEDLDAAARELNHRLHGLTLCQVRRQLQREVDDDERLCRLLRCKVLEAVCAASGRGARLLVNGQVRLFRRSLDGQPGLDWREVLAAMEEKKRLIRLLDHCLRATGVHLFLGAECPFGQETGCAVVAAKFAAPDDRMRGTVAVVGPMRLDYDHVVPLVDLTAKLLSARLSRVAEGFESLAIRL